MPWRYAFWGSLAVGLLLMLVALVYPALVPTNQGTSESDQRIWAIAQTVFGVWVGLIGGQRTK